MNCASHVLERGTGVNDVEPDVRSGRCHLLALRGELSG